ncbi:hypothetical protein JCM16408A_51100 [Methylobacterium phyllosphaerae]
MRACAFSLSYASSRWRRGWNIGDQAGPEANGTAPTPSRDFTGAAPPAYGPPPLLPAPVSCCRVIVRTAQPYHRPDPGNGRNRRRPRTDLSSLPEGEQHYQW